ncbi:efflux transporter outer membrane subunit [Luteimonas sp. BDR2-5]|uniref:efflux transporter outer membrane subunit n=1 Tax=Proluteimonas luteida TaxID=2878685 RepID=UPI001E2D317B|nr:efflux transporter outer membrane subunit [Luteimonas sp. BDR2-5]MCD9029000.1 efflux transporter outer membrane subunit [Luteimonas sp. BDR2-5]
MGIRLATITALAAALLSACAVGPDHVRPTMALPDAFAGEAAADPGAAGASAIGPAQASIGDDAFWRHFDDPQLTALVETALAANHDLRIALSRHDRARALLRESRLDALPTLTASGEARSARASAGQQPGVSRADRDGDSFSAALGASWELDLFGRVRRGIEAGRAGAAASADDLRAAQVAIVGEVAAGYLELRGLQERLRVAEDNAGNQRDTLRLVEARAAAGQDSAFDTARARAQVASTTARIPALQARIATTMHRLAVLTGRTPDALHAELSPPRALPAIPARIDPGTPGTLLRRRPDVAAAEQRLHAATARIGVATADLFPRFTLGGLLGSQAVDSSALLERDSETRVVALGIDWSFLDVGRVRARIAASHADAEGELARYQQTVLLALEDTENALVGYARAREEDAQLEQAAIDSARAAQLARLRFDAGATGLLDVLDAERTRLQAQDAFADGRTRSATGAVALYRALAGGWPQTLPLREALGQR